MRDMAGRRAFLTSGAAWIATVSCSGVIGVGAAKAASPNIQRVELRGSIDASAEGIVPGAADNQSRALQRLINEAARSGLPLYLPPGRYNVSNLDLPEGTRLTGVAGATRLVYGGEGHLLQAGGGRRVEISNITLDGANRWLADYAPALVALRGVDEVVLDNCEIVGSRKHGLQMERCGGRVFQCRISGAALAGLYSVEATGLSLQGNTVSDCGNGGILVHRWSNGPDATIVTGNRVSRIAALAGGTGQNGNGINIFRAGNVIVSGNHVSDCAFSAIRANSASNVQISGNQCLQSGETAIYAEFAFQGAVIADNIVDGAANGVLVVNLDEDGRLATVSGNVVRNLKLDGPYIHDGAGFGFGIAVEGDTAVTGNVIENAPKWGMALGWGPYLKSVVASGNVIRNAPVGIAVSVVEGSGTAIISGNVMDRTPQGAIIGYRWKEAASGDLIDDASDWPHLVVTGNRKS